MIAQPADTERPEHVNIRFEAPPTLARFMDSDAFIRCVTGPVGSGKSSACVLELLRRASEQRPGPGGIRRSRWAVIRNTYGQLRDTTRKTFEHWIPSALGRWNEQRFTFTIEVNDIHAEVMFRALDSAGDVNKLLSLELTGAYINESREIPQEIFDQLQTRLWRYPPEAEEGSTWCGIWMDSNPWWSTHWLAKLFKKPPPGHSIFRQPGGREPNAENLRNLRPGYYQTICHGKDAEWISVYVDGQEASSEHGSVLGRLLGAIEARGGISDFAHPNDGIFTAWDLGLSDSTAIWFFRMGQNRQPDFVDHYENSGFPISHYFEELEKRGYQYVKHWLPHDARAHNLETGNSIVERFVERYGVAAVGIAPELPVDEGIGAARWLLEQPIRFHSRCEAGIETLKSYRYSWDDKNQCFSKTPLHNFASHTADALRYAACALRESEWMTRPPPPKVNVIITPELPTLDEMWKDRQRQRAVRERIR